MPKLFNQTVRLDYDTMDQVKRQRDRLQRKLPHLHVTQTDILRQAIMIGLDRSDWEEENNKT